MLAKISQGVAKFISFARLAKFVLACENFTRGCKIHSSLLALCLVACTPLGQFASLGIFRKGLRNC